MRYKHDLLTVNFEIKSLFLPITFLDWTHLFITKLFHNKYIRIYIL